MTHLLHRPARCGQACPRAKRTSGPFRRRYHGPHARLIAGQLVVAISSRPLRGRRTGSSRPGRPRLRQLQLRRLERAAKPGVAFSLVNKLARLQHAGLAARGGVLSRNDPVSGMRVFRSARHYGLPSSAAYSRATIANPGATCARWRQPVSLHQRGRRALGAGRRRAPRASTRTSRRASRRASRQGALPTAMRCCSPTGRARLCARAGCLPAHEHARAATPAPGRSKPLLEALQQLQRRAEARYAHPRGDGAQRRHLSAPSTALMDWHRRRRGDVPRQPAKGRVPARVRPDFFFDTRPATSRTPRRALPAGRVAAGVANQAEPASAEQPRGRSSSGRRSQDCSARGANSWPRRLNGNGGCAQKPSGL